jgi:hypothetical protein
MQISEAGEQFLGSQEGLISMEFVNWLVKYFISLGDSDPIMTTTKVKAQFSYRHIHIQSEMLHEWSSLHDMEMLFSSYP